MSIKSYSQKNKTQNRKIIKSYIVLFTIIKLMRNKCFQEEMITRLSIKVLVREI